MTIPSMSSLRSSESPCRIGRAARPPLERVALGVLRTGGLLDGAGFAAPGLPPVFVEALDDRTGALLRPGALLAVLLFPAGGALEVAARFSAISLGIIAHMV